MKCKSISRNMSDENKSLSHLVLLGLAFLFGCALWAIVNFDVYSRLSGKALHHEILSDLIMQVAETVLLLEVSLGYVRLIIKYFWKYPHNIRFVLIQVVVLAVLNGLVSTALGLVYYWIFPAQERIFAKVAYTDFFSLSVFSTACFAFFLVNRHQEESTSRLKTEIQFKEQERILLETKLKNYALKTDNHFILNCLSTLSGLVDTSPSDAKDFLVGLSSVYRYLVACGGEKLVPLSQEISFVNDYVKLVRCRFSGIDFIADEGLSNQNAFVCPVALQSLVENAIKHNRHEEGDPLSIRVALDADRIVVSNNIAPLQEEATGTKRGLGLLKERYSLLTEKEVSVTDDGKTFTVSVPVLYLEDLDDESIDN